MAKPLRPKRGTTAKNDAFVGLASEITVDTEKHSIRVHDGVTAGGHETIMSNGGTLKSAITVDGNTLAKAKTDNGVYALRGGTTTSNCPRVVLYGPQNASAPGCFMFHANDGVNGDKSLIGDNKGVLSWDGKEVARFDQMSSNASFLKFHDGSMIARGEKIGHGFVSVTFPLPFKELPTVIPFVGASGNAIVATITGRSTTGCNIVTRQSTSNNEWGTDATVGYIAFGRWK